MDEFHSGYLRLAAHYDPPGSAAQLASSGLFDAFVAYERSVDQMWFAADPLARITITRRGALVTSDDGQTKASTGVCAISQVGALIDTSTQDSWTAYGYATFEAGYVGTSADFSGRAGGSDRAPDHDVLVEAMVPGTEVRVTGDMAHVRSTRLDRVRDVCRVLACSPPPTAGAELADIDALDVIAQQARYEASVGAALDEIANGRLAKVVLSRKIELPFAVDLPRTYLHGRRHNTPARSFLLNLGRYRAMGLCPETVLEVDSAGWVTTQPLAGTRGRGFGAERDAALRHELINDPKEIYEHLISVRAARQDLSRVCAPDTIAVSDLLAVKDRGSVQHLASTLHGRLRPGRSQWEAFQALSPAVTVSGFPKEAARACIERLEQSSRGLYGGAVFVAGSDGTLDAGLVLRALIDDGTGPRIQAGAGIVAGSLPTREYQETCAKLRSVTRHLVAADEQASPAADGVRARRLFVEAVR